MRRHLIGSNTRKLRRTSSNLLAGRAITRSCHPLTPTELGADFNLGGIEVDFVLYGEAGLIAIEVKRKRRSSGNDLRGLQAFTDEYPMAKCYVLANVPQPQTLNGIAVVPLSQVFHQLPQILGAH